MVIGIVVIAAVLLVLSPSCTVFLTWGSWRRYRRISTTSPATTCAQLEQGEQLPRWVIVAARTGGREVLRAPRSGRECVWFQVDYARSPNGDEQVIRWLDLPEATPLVPITDGTATAYLTPRLAQTRLAGPAPAVVTGSGRDGDVSWQEVIVPPDVPVFVRARPVPTERIGSLMTVVGEDGPWRLPRFSFVMSTRRTAEPAGIVLETGWSGPYGVSLLPTEDVRRGFATSLRRWMAALLGPPALGVALLLGAAGWEAATG